MIIVSACLAGEKCRYDGNSKSNHFIIDLIREGKAIAVCPEVLGGLGIPRIECEKKGNKIISKNGEDMTRFFVQGALEAMKIAKDNNCTKAILKSKSPSCGYKTVYDGTFCGKIKKGNGVFAQMLEDESFEIFTEEDFK